MNKKTLVALIVVAIIAIIGVFSPIGQTTVERITEKNVGAIPGNQLPEDGQFGEIEYYTDSIGLNTASSTLCALPAPTSGTTTIDRFTVSLRTATTSSLYVELGKADSQFATTTSLGTATLEANANGAVVTATDSEGGLYDAHTITSGQWLVVKAASAEGVDGYTNFAPVGACQGMFYGVN